MDIAYLVPIYPMPSQTFIRREIAALEARGMIVHRFAARRFDRELADEADRAEQGRTDYLVEAGPSGLGLALAREALTRPGRWLKALATAVRLGRRSERGLIRHLIFLAEACLLRRRLLECGARHVHAHFGTNSADIALLCRLLGGPPYSVTIHGPEEFDAPLPLGLGEKIRHAAFVVAISQFTRSQLYRWCRSDDWPKIRVVRCGLDGAFLSATAVPVPEEPRLVNIGRLSEQKGQLLLIEAARLLRDRGVEFELVIVGDGPMRGQLEGLIDRSGLRDRVRITGFLDNDGVRRELMAARALVLPSFAEGLPVVIMEALALGRPVISTYVAGIPELVEPGQDGWLVPAGDVGSLVDAMAEALAADPAVLEQMGRDGATRVAEHHDAQAEAEELASLFSGPARDRPAPHAPAFGGAAAVAGRESAGRTMPRTRPLNLLIVVVNYRTAGLTIDCLQSLEAEVAEDAGCRVRVVVTDNASGDDSIPRLRAAVRERGWGDWVVIQPLDHNGGFASGNNAAIRPALESDDPPDYVWLLNPDTVVRPGAMRTLVDFMEGRPGVGIVGCRLEDPDGTPQRSAFRFPSVLGELEGGIRLSVVTKLLSRWVIAPPVSEESCPTDWVAGASMIVRGAVFEAVGLLDEDYFMYFEEVDFCRRARRSGWACWYVPQARVIHLVGQSSGVTDPGAKWRRRPAYWFRARRRYFLSHLGSARTLAADLSWVVGYSLFRVRHRLRGRSDIEPGLLRDFIHHNFFPGGR